MKHYWHIHHSELVEGSEDIEERIEYIQENKPLEEQPLRLRLLGEVKGKLPQAYIEASKAYIEASKAYDEAKMAYIEAWTVCDNARTICDKAWKSLYKSKMAYTETKAVCDKARAAYDKARAAADKVITALHATECAECPWDGHTIFPTKLREKKRK